MKKEPTLMKITYNVGITQWQTLKELSKKKSLSMGSLIRIAINDFIDKENK